MRAYLDILAPDTIALNDLLSTLDELTQSPPDTDNPLITQGASITIRFGVEPALENKRAEQLKALIAAIRPLLEAWATSKAL